MSNMLNVIQRVPASEFLPLFKRQYLLEWIRKNRFQRYMGTGETMPIQFKYELKQGGATIQFNFLRRASSTGIGGTMVLEGRESTTAREKCVIKVDYMREAFAIDKSDERKSIVELLPQFKPLLMNWSKEKLRDRIIDATSMVAPDLSLVAPLYNPDPTRWLAGDPGVQITTLTANASDITNWLTNNGDRVQFGNASGSSSYFSTTFATAMAAVTGSTDGFTTTSVSMLKDLAKNSNPHIEPIRVGEDDEEYYVIFVDTKSFRQLQKDPVMQAANQYARAREGDGWKKNPIRTGADLEWDGCIIREVPEMKPIIYDSAYAGPVLTSGAYGVGSYSGSSLAYVNGGGTGAWRAALPSELTSSLASCRGRAILTGVNAIGVAVAQEPDFPDQERDYKFRKGLAIEECLNVNKIARQDLNVSNKFVDNATVSGFYNAAA